MSYSRYKTVNFGPARLSLATVGYALVNADGTAAAARATIGVAERPTASGIYGATISFPDAFVGSVIWDTGETSPAYAVEEINPGNSEYLDAKVTSRGDATAASQTTIIGALSSLGGTLGAVKSKTDALPAVPAARGDLPTDYQQRGVAVTLPTTAPSGYGGTITSAALTTAFEGMALVFRDLTAVTAPTGMDALCAAYAAIACPASDPTGTTLTVYQPDGKSVLRTFAVTVDTATNEPVSRA